MRTHSPCLSIRARQPAPTLSATLSLWDVTSLRSRCSTKQIHFLNDQPAMPYFRTLIVVTHFIVFLITQYERVLLRIVPVHLSCLCPSEMTFSVFHLISRNHVQSMRIQANPIRYEYVSYQIHFLHIVSRVVRGPCGDARI